jgi:stage V sporulation protein G
MEISEVKIFPVSEEKLKAFVSVVFDQCFMVNDIKVIHGRDGLFISMPSRRKKNGEFKDVAHPLNNETRRLLEERILAEYERVTAGREDGSSALDGGSLPRMIDSGGPGSQVATSGLAPRAAPRAAQPPALGTAATGPAASEPGAPAGEPRPEAKTLEEVEELHLRDSFWSVP